MLKTFERTIEPKIYKHIESIDNKILFIWGPRRSGKTTILKKIADKTGSVIFNFDNFSDREIFIPKKESLKQIATENKLILIDEVQNYPESTLALKILHDEFGAKVIATGSSELRQKGADFDSLSGRFKELFCLPLSLEETVQNEEAPDYRIDQLVKEKFKDQIAFGFYPEIVNSKDVLLADKISLLELIIDTYVLKDIVNIYDLKNIKLARDILIKLALQIGSEVSTREIANSLQANMVTVSNYIEILVKNYVLIALPSFKTNARRAVSQNKKYYFLDIGIRNALVKDFREINLRPDKGGVFENFFISEVEKLKKNYNFKFNTYFYREYSGKEVDLIIEDYKKNYISIEIKFDSQSNNADIFPLESKIFTANSSNYYEIINKLYVYFRQREYPSSDCNPSII